MKLKKVVQIFKAEDPKLWKMMITMNYSWDKDRFNKKTDSELVPQFDQATQASRIKF